MKTSLDPSSKINDPSRAESRRPPSTVEAAALNAKSPPRMSLPLLRRSRSAAFQSLCGPLFRSRTPIIRRGVCAARSAISDEVGASLKEAMLAKDAGRLRALRGIRAAFLTAMKEDGADTLEDAKAIAALRRLAKMRRESITMFRQGGRTDLADAEEEELKVIEHWLPVLADEEQTRAWAQEAIDATGAKSRKEFGKVMGYVMKDHRADVDGDLLKHVVGELLP